MNVEKKDHVIEKSVYDTAQIFNLELVGDKAIIRPLGDPRLQFAAKVGSKDEIIDFIRSL